MIKFATVILAAGASSRMGRPKMVLPWRNTTVIGHLVEVWKQAGAAQIVIVRSGENTILNAELNRTGFPSEHRIINPHPTQGMFTSIRCAARWSGWEAGISHWVLALGDQPHLSLALLTRILNAANEHPGLICQPSRQQRPRHPVVLPRKQWQELAVSEHPTLKEFLAAHSDVRSFVEVNDPALDLDIDEPSDYATALQLYSDG